MYDEIIVIVLVVLFVSLSIVLLIVVFTSVIVAFAFVLDGAPSDATTAAVAAGHHHHQLRIFAGKSACIGCDVLCLSLLAVGGRGIVASGSASTFGQGLDTTQRRELWDVEYRRCAA